MTGMIYTEGKKNKGKKVYRKKTWHFIGWGKYR